MDTPVERYHDLGRKFIVYLCIQPYLLWPDPVAGSGEIVPIFEPSEKPSGKGDLPASGQPGLCPSGVGSRSMAVFIIPPASPGGPL